MPLSRAGFSAYSSRGGNNEVPTSTVEFLVVGSTAAGAAGAHHLPGQLTFILFFDTVQSLAHGGGLHRDRHHVALHDTDYHLRRDRPLRSIRARPLECDAGCYLERGPTALVGYDH